MESDSQFPLSERSAVEPVGHGAVAADERRPVAVPRPVRARALLLEARAGRVGKWRIIV